MATKMNAQASTWIANRYANTDAKRKAIDRAAHMKRVTSVGNTSNQYSFTFIENKAEKTRTSWDFPELD